MKGLVFDLTGGFRNVLIKGGFMSLDEQKWIAAQAIMKAIIEKKEIVIESIPIGFKAIMKIMEDYATIPEDEEWINTEIPITKDYWNLTPQNQVKMITEYGKPMPIVNKVGRKEWYVHVQRKSMEKFKTLMNEFNKIGE